MPPVSDHDLSSNALDEIPEGQNSLRLVKIRLALTLIAVAILPFAAIAPIARAVLDDTRTGLEQRLAAESEHAAADIRRELAEVGASIETLAASAAIITAVGVPAADPAVEPAAVALDGMLARPSGAIIGAAISDPSGSLHVRAGSESVAFAGIPPISAGAEYNLVPGSGNGATVEIAAVIQASPDAAPLGWVVVAIDVESLMSWASSGAVGGHLLELHDGHGRVLASAGFDQSNIPGTVIDLAANGSETSEGVAQIGLSQLDAWQVVTRAPLPVSSIPFPAVVALVGLLGLLIGFVWWMGRQILRPAAELEDRRARLHDLYQTARDAALRDSLTGLGNHRAFQEAVSQMIDQSRRYGMPFGLILLDIDEFKRINDTRGHATGDELLSEVGNLIRATVRQADTGFRIGGDEFAILLPSTDSAGAEIMARRLLSRGLEDRPGGGYRSPISFSAGVTACPEFGTTRVEVTAQADAALYRGKRAGRTVVTTFDPDIDRGHVDDGMRSELSAALSVVIESGALTPVYQPIIHLATGRILGYEGLVRVPQTSGFANTGALFDAAEVAGRVLDLDRAALEVVLRGSHAIPQGTLISINVSPRSFEAPEFNATVFLAILRRHGVAPDRVLLELTERDAIENLDRLRAAVTQLQAAGVRIAADDVGAGNAGLRLLSQFRFDAVKIDLSLVQGGASTNQTLSVLTSLVQLARRWGALTIAEGVETSAQLQMIRALDIEAGQGYLLGRPGPVLEVNRLELDDLAGDGGEPGAGGGGQWTSIPVVGANAPVLVGAGVGGGPITAAAPAPSSANGGSNMGPTGWGAPVPVRAPLTAPTAASIIASGAPNPFGTRPH